MIKMFAGIASHLLLGESTIALLRKVHCTSFLATSLLSFRPQFSHHLLQETLAAVTSTWCPPSDLDALSTS